MAHQTAGVDTNWEIIGRRAASASIGMFLAFILIVTSLHFIRPDLAPLGTYISDYATGAFGSLMTIAFLTFSCGLFLLAGSLLVSAPWQSRPWVGVTLLLVCSIFMIFVASNPSDPPGQAATRVGEIHDQFSGLTFLVLIVVMLYLSVKLWRSEKLAGLHWSLPGMAVAAPILLVAAFGPMQAIGLAGLGQRIFLLDLLAWLLLFALGMRNRSFTG